MPDGPALCCVAAINGRRSPLPCPLHPEDDAEPVVLSDAEKRRLDERADEAIESFLDDVLGE